MNFCHHTAFAQCHVTTKGILTSWTWTEKRTKWIMFPESPTHTCLAGTVTGEGPFGFVVSREKSDSYRKAFFSI